VDEGVTREAIRDLYDLDRLLDAGADLSSPEFMDLVDAKRRKALAERSLCGGKPRRFPRPRTLPDAASITLVMALVYQGVACPSGPAAFWDLRGVSWRSGNWAHRRIGDVSLVW
jgi:hypothetical protein